MTNKGAHITTASRPQAVPDADALRQLIDACRRNDRTAQRNLYDAYAPFIYGVIRRFSNDDSVAQDIQSEAFYRIFKRLEQYRFEGAFEGWIRRIAVHAVADHFRKQRPDAAAISEDAEDIAVYHDPGGPGQLAYKELLNIIHQLPQTQRAVFNLFVFEQYGHKEIASLLDISENNSRWHLNDARRRLKEKITATNR